MDGVSVTDDHVFRSQNYGVMMVQLSPAPDRAQWLEERKTRLGATDVSAILGLNPYRTAYEAWLDKKGLLENWEGNDATYLGSLLEPAILDEAEKRWGTIARNVCAKHDTAPIAVTLDGWLVGNAEPVEIKTAGLTNEFAELGHWGESATDQIPEWYLLQVQTQLLCTDAEWCRMLALISGRGLVYYCVKRDEKVGNVIETECSKWWQKHIIEGIEPERNPAPSIEILKRIRRVPDTVCEFGRSELELIEDWQVAKQEASAAEKRAKELQAAVLMALGTNEGALLPDGRTLTYLETHRKGYIVEPTSYRQLKVKK